jgi:hypothetical protein
LKSLHRDVVIAADQMPDIEPLLAARFQNGAFPSQSEIAVEGSKLQIQVQASRREVLAVPLPVAKREYVLQGRIWAAQEFPELRERTPAGLLPSV